MKFIHTADLHIGNQMHDVEREGEHIEFFEWLKNSIISSKAEALVIAGDIYDTANPSNSAKKIFNSFLASLIGTDCKNIIVVGGNHDSGALLDSNSELMEMLNIHIVGSILNRELSDLIFELKDKDNNTSGICVAIPFVKEIDLQKFVKSDDETIDSEDREGHLADRAFSSLYRQAFDLADELRGDRQIPIITTGHLYAANLEGRYSEENMSERPDDGVRVIDVMGNLGAVHSDTFPDEFDYVALGHIHYNSKVAGNKKIQYSGSPFVMGFDETNYTRKVLAVECIFDEDVKIDSLVVPSSYKYKRISGTRDKIYDDIQQLISENDDSKKVYLEICYSGEDRVRVRDMLDSLSLPENIHIVSTKVINIVNGNRELLSSYTSSELRSISPEDIFKEHILSYLSKTGDGIEDEAMINKYMSIYMEAFNEVMLEENKDEDLKG